MKIAFEANFGKVWIDNLTPYVFTLITTVPTPSQAAVFFDTKLELLKSMNKQFKESYLVSDFSKTTENARKELCNYYMEYIPRFVKAKVSYIAFVCPHNTVELLTPEKKEKLSQAPLGMYPTFVEALASVNLKRSLELSQRYERSIL